MLLLVPSGCVERKPDGSWEIDKNLRRESVTHGPFVEIIDSCEYVIWEGGMSHKGNCKHYRKHYEELIRTCCNYSSIDWVY